MKLASPLMTQFAIDVEREKEIILSGMNGDFWYRWCIKGYSDVCLPKEPPPQWEIEYILKYGIFFAMTECLLPLLGQIIIGHVESEDGTGWLSWPSGIVRRIPLSQILVCLGGKMVKSSTMPVPKDLFFPLNICLLRVLPLINLTLNRGQWCLTLQLTSVKWSMDI